MNRTNKIMFAILAILVMSALLAIIDISLGMKGRKGSMESFTSTTGLEPGIGVVRIIGAINNTQSGASPWNMENGSDSIVKRLDELSRDKKIKAIVVRIDSPGGSVAAFQEIYDKMLKVRVNKPLICSMGNVAASGGYYAASACNYIFANYGTITGSIGVIIMAPNLKGLFEKLGINMTVIKSGRYKDILASNREITSEERALLQDMIDTSYQKFLQDVSVGRNLPVSSFAEYADGRVMTGSSALKIKLVDELGTYESAVAKACEMAKLPADAPVYDDVKSPFEEIFSGIEGRFMGNISPLSNIANPSVNILEYRYLP